MVLVVIIYLKCRMMEQERGLGREGERWEINLICTGSLSPCMRPPGPGQAETRSLTPHLSLAHGWAIIS